MAVSRYRRLNKVIWITILAVLVFGYLDSQQIQGVQDTEKGWAAYQEFVAPIFQISWMLVLLALAVVYWLFTKDWSESLAIFAVPFILVKAGLEDIFFFMFSEAKMTVCMDWFGKYQNTVSKYILRETCVSPLGLYLNVIGAIVIVYLVFRWLKRAKF